MIEPQGIMRAIQNLRPLDDIGGEPAGLQQRMQHYGVPGVSVAVLDGGSIDSVGYGLKQVGEAAHVDTRTMFQAASISKPVFALAVMRLVEQGLLDLDADIQAYLKSWQVPAVDGWQPRLTLRLLLSHRAGLTVHGFPGYPADAKLPSLVQILQGELPANTKPVVADMLPEQHFRYSGGGTTLAQLVVEDVLGRPLPQIMDELILTPLRLKYSTYAQPLPDALNAQAASGHLQSGEPVAGKCHIYPEMAAAGLWTTPGDLVRIGKEVQAALRGEGKLFRRETVETMLTPQLTDSLPIADAISIGFFLNGTGNSARFLHSGSNHGYLSRLTMFRESRQGTAIMVNSDRGQGLIAEIEAAIAAEFGWAGYAPLAGSKLSGTYRSRFGHEFAVKQSGDSLELCVPGQQPLRLNPIGTANHQFRILELGTVVHFQLDSQGNATDLRLMSQGRLLEAARS